MKLGYWLVSFTLACLLNPALADPVTTDDAASVPEENNPAAQTTIQGQDAGGHRQTTIIDQNGNLKVVTAPSSTQATPSSNTKTSAGMNQSAPTVVKPPASPPSTAGSKGPASQQGQAPKDNGMPPGAIRGQLNTAPNMQPPPSAPTP
jgi:hypothetical protein